MANQKVQERAAELMRESPSLAASHAERIAALEQEVELWRTHAFTDPVSGLLNERAHFAVREVRDKAHVVMTIKDVKTVYENCGQRSGNTFLGDIAAIIKEEADKHGVQAFRIGTAKLAFLAESNPAAEAFVSELERVLGSVWVTCKIPRGTRPDHVCGAGSALTKFLLTHEDPFGLDIRVTNVGSMRSSFRKG